MSILSGLKNLIFVDQPVEKKPEPATPQPVAPTVNTTAPEPTPAFSNNSYTPTSATSDKDMKLKIYQLLENMNKPGCDFFEVWNAATEMGGANSVNIKAAFTSLKFADKTLTKDKLLETGTYYKTNLKSVLDAESNKIQEEKTRLDKEKEQMKSSLVNEITSLEQQITALQEKLAARKQDRDNINEKYEPRIAEFDYRIKVGQQSVNGVVAEMQQVLDIIQKELA